MRVIAGKYRGRTLVAPKQDVRPTLDRMKETLFNILNFKLQHSVVLDLFSGSGQLGIECLSRGADRAVLCDNNRDSIATIKYNLDKLGVTDAEIFFGDYKRCITSANIKFDLIFVDPPYRSGYYIEALQGICLHNLLTDNGIIVCEHLAQEELPLKVDFLEKYDSRKIGTVKFDFYRRTQCE